LKGFPTHLFISLLLRLSLPPPPQQRGHAPHHQARDPADHAENDHLKGRHAKPQRVRIRERPERRHIRVDHRIQQDVADRPKVTAQQSHPPGDHGLRPLTESEQIQAQLPEVLPAHGRSRAQHNRSHKCVGNPVDLPPPGQHHDQRLQVHHHLRPGEDQQAELFIQYCFNGDCGAYVKGCEWHRNLNTPIYKSPSIIQEAASL